MVQRRAVRFISDLRGRGGVTSEREALGLEVLQDRRKDARVKLSLKILSSDTNSPLADNFNNITAQQTAKKLPSFLNVNITIIYLFATKKTNKNHSW